MFSRDFMPVAGAQIHFPGQDRVGGWGGYIQYLKIVKRITTTLAKPWGHFTDRSFAHQGHKPSCITTTMFRCTETWLDQPSIGERAKAAAPTRALADRDANSCRAESAFNESDHDCTRSRSPCCVPRLVHSFLVVGFVLRPGAC